MPQTFPLTFLYLLALIALSIALGIQIVLLPWLVVDHLSLNSVAVGWVQAAALIPNLLLLLVGGVTADSGQAMRGLMPLILVNCVIHGTLALVLNTPVFGLLLLIAYATLLGVTNAFIQPWREYILKKITDQGLQKLVAKTSLCLYGGQALGFTLVSFMETLGVTALLAAQVLMCLMAAICFKVLIAQLRQPKHDQTKEADEPSREPLFKSLCGGLRDIWSNTALRSLVVIVGFNGFFHIGVFIVSLPLVVQQVYQREVDFFSSLQIAFVLGTITTTLVVVYKSFFKEPGKRIIFGMLYSGVIMLALSARPTITGLLMLIFCWGAVVGVSANMGRSLLQALAPEASRGRMISIYQLSLFGCAALGALLAGYAIDYWGVLYLLKVSGIVSIVAFIFSLFTRSLWAVEVIDTDNSTAK